MSCYAVWTKAPNKQIRVYPYSVADSESRLRARQFAIDLANSMHDQGATCFVEEFGLVDVGVLVYDTERP